MSEANPSRRLRMVPHGGTRTTKIANDFLHDGARALIEAPVSSAGLHFASTMPHCNLLCRISPSASGLRDSRDQTSRVGRKLRRLLGASPGQEDAD